MRRWGGRGIGPKGASEGNKELSMKYILRRVMVVAMVFSLDVIGSNEWPHEVNEHLYADEESGGRSYHGAMHDMMTGSELSPFMYTNTMSSVGLSLRATSFLLGHLYAAAEDTFVRDQMMGNMDSFCENILNLYVLCHEAVRSVERQLDEVPERSGYLLEQVEHLHQRVVVLVDYFGALVDDTQSHEISTVLVTLNKILKKTGQMLAL
jgi:hypothetical protein